MKIFGRKELSISLAILAIALLVIFIGTWVKNGGWGW